MACYEINSTIHVYIYIYIYIYTRNDSSKQKYYFWSNNYEVSYIEFTVIIYFLPILGENVFLSTQFSKNASISSSLNMRDQVSQPQKITGNITFIYPRILIPTILNIRRREKILNGMVEKILELKEPYFFLQAMLPFSCHNEILELCLTFTRFVSYIYITILSYMLTFITDEEKSYV